MTFQSPSFQHLIVLACFSLSGCGYSTYEQRLADTKDFYEYLEVVDSSLASPAWDRRDVGMTMRVPMPFKGQLAGPEKMQDDDGNVSWGEDPRQPNVLGIDLEGLVDAWQATMSDAAGEQVDSRMYVLSNHQRWLEKEAGAAAPQDFLTDLEHQLMSAFQVTVPGGESGIPGDNVHYRQLIPDRGSLNAKYNTPKDFTIVRFVPENTVGGQDLQGLLYEHTSGDIQMAVLILCPKTVTSQFRNRVDLALQTLQVAGQAPKGSTGTGGTGGGGKSGAAGAF